MKGIILPWWGDRSHCPEPPNCSLRWVLWSNIDYRHAKMSRHSLTIRLICILYWTHIQWDVSPANETIWCIIHTHILHCMLVTTHDWINTFHAQKINEWNRIKDNQWFTRRDVEVHFPGPGVKWTAPMIPRFTQSHNMPYITVLEWLLE